MIKNFDQYSSQFSADPLNFLNRVAIATDESFNHSYFHTIKNKFDLLDSPIDVPVIITDSFNESTQIINESLSRKYNSSVLPNREELFDLFKSSSYVPNETNDIKKIKSLKFPITAAGRDYRDDYKSITQLKNSERLYSRFTEKPAARTRFKILGFKNEPISIVEWINKFPLDVELNGFQYMNEAQDLCKRIYEKFKSDVYNIEVIESIDGKIYIESIDRKLDLNPHQAKLLYESIYEDFYRTRLPNWVKNKINEEYSKSYYKRKVYDTELIKSKHCINYSKYL
jgi:hypothetical protein